jgi:hypothetical protein
MNKPTTEAALATYGTILAVILSISAFVVGFNKTNIFAILAFSPMIIYFLHEFFHKIFSPDEDPSSPTNFSVNKFSFTGFLLQDSLIFRLTLSLFFVSLVAILAKAYVSADLIQQVSTEIISPLP